jgi:precorrin-8X/cobalt-precorrin-8 methylmutase
MFDTFAMVDWSAAAVPRKGRDSIWISWHAPDGERLENPPTRHTAKMLLGDWLAAALSRSERVLLGFDFPFGYPSGFAARLGLAGPPWRAVWDEIGQLIEDTEENRNNRFTIAAELNRRVSGGCFPFWGCPVGLETPYLRPKHHRRHDSDGLAERRLVDLHIPTAQPCWKLLGTGSVGGQALTGIPVVAALRNDPRWEDRIRVWPFETGLRPPGDGAVVIAEVYPSLWAVKPDDGETKDAAQVRAVARFFAERDHAGELAALFAGAPALTAPQRHRVETEEAWTLGVTAAKQRPIPTLTHPAPSIESAKEKAPLRPSGGRGRGPSRSDRRVRWASPQTGPLQTSPAAPLTQPSPPGRRGERIETRLGAGEGTGPGVYCYLRDPAEITRRSFELIRSEADLTRFPPALQPVALRLAHAAGDVTILNDLIWSRGVATAARKALAAGAPILVDSAMVAAGIMTARLPAQNTVICTLRDPATEQLVVGQSTTRSAAAVELWRPHLSGAVVAIGNAPTALFRLLEILAAGAARPALVLGFPVGFIGAVEAKAALAAFGRGLNFITLKGRRGGSALAAAAVNALASAG